MAAFSVGEAAWSVCFLFLAAGALTAILSGAWSGLRSKTAWLCLGAILILDLGRSDLPWRHYFDYDKEYSENDPVEFLTANNKPYEQRVMNRLAPRRTGSSTRSLGMFGQLYSFWMQNVFPAHEIQCLDFAEMPRIQEMDDAYMHNFEIHATNNLFPAARLWELTGTRYLFLNTHYLSLLNDFADPAQRRFHIRERYRVVLKEPNRPPEDVGDYTVFPDRGAKPDPASTNAIIEFDGVLPRAKLFAHWETPADGPATLATLLSTNFIPAQTVLLWTNPPVAQAPADPMADAGTVQITGYHPKDIQLNAVAKLPAVLLLNERFAPTWSVSVDHKPAAMLRCNYIMRGVFLPPGQHTVEFRYHASLTYLYVSLAGWAAGILVAGYLFYSGRPKKNLNPAR
jgi:hypothetical protein